MKEELQSKIQKYSVSFSSMLCGLGWPLVTDVFEEPVGAILTF